MCSWHILGGWTGAIQEYALRRKKRQGKGSQFFGWTQTESSANGQRNPTTYC